MAASSVPITCGTAVAEAGHLTRDLVCPATAITVGASATIDLRGFTLRGPGSRTGTPAIVIEGEPPSASVTLRNGTVTGWGSAVRGDVFEVVADRLVVRDTATAFDGNAAALVATRSRFVRNDVVVSSQFGSLVDVRRSTFVDNGSVFLEGSYTPSVQIDRSTFRGNDVVVDVSEGSVTVTRSVFVDGEVAIRSFWGQTSVRHSTFRDYGTAIETRWLPGAWPALHSDQFVDNTFTRNGVALELGVNATVVGSDFRANGTGIRSRTAGTPNPVSDIVLTANLFTRNGDGVLVDTVAHLRDNRATRNLGYGFNVPLAVDLGGNVASRNGIDCVGLVC